MTSPGSKDEKQALPSNPHDLATAYRELTKGEQTATQLESNLTSLESKLDAMLAAFEQQAEGSSRSKPDDETGSEGHAGGGGGSRSSKGA